MSSQFTLEVNSKTSVPYLTPSLTVLICALLSCAISSILCLICSVTIWFAEDFRAMFGMKSRENDAKRQLRSAKMISFLRTRRFGINCLANTYVPMELLSSWLTLHYRESYMNCSKDEQYLYLLFKASFYGIVLLNHILRFRKHRLPIIVSSFHTVYPGNHRSNPKTPHSEAYAHAKITLETEKQSSKSGTEKDTEAAATKWAWNKLFSTIFYLCFWVWGSLETILQYRSEEFKQSEMSPWQKFRDNFIHY